MNNAVDLFGVPVTEPRGRGRPPHVPSAASRRHAADLHAEGLAQPEIAKAMGLTVPTLIRHYGDVLKSNARRLPLKSSLE
jgi:hypothetical protein